MKSSASIYLPSQVASLWECQAAGMESAALVQTARRWCKYIATSPWTLLLFKLTIGLVSAYDIFLTIKYVDSLPAMELNPVGRWLMHLDSGPECRLEQIAAFIAAKFAGNFLTLAILELVCHWKRNVAICIAASVAAAQLLLLHFLTQS